MGSYHYFYYDEQYIELCPTQYYPSESYGINFYIALRQWPDYFTDNDLSQPSEESSLITLIGIDPFPNTPSSITVPKDSDNFTIEAAGITYNNAKRAEVEDMGETYVSQSLPLPFLKYIYFVPLKGVVGFDDRNDHHWRLQ